MEVVTKDGATYEEHVVSVRGTVENPMTGKEVQAKCLGLLEPVLGQECARKLTDTVMNLEQVRDVRELRSLLSALKPTKC